MATKPKAVSVSLFDQLLKIRDEERAQRQGAIPAIAGDKLPLENNRMGFYRWYLHPDIKNTATHTLLLWVQEIPPGSRSGKQRTQGGQFHLVLEGRGYTIIDGVRHDWETDDAIFLPLLEEGTVHQHFNADPKKPARLLCAEPNLVGALGVDKGSGFEQLEDSPDYKP